MLLCSSELSHNVKKLYLNKNKRVEKLSRQEQEELIIDLVNAVVSAKSLRDAALLLQDLLTKSEIKILSKRLRIAKLLIQGMSYEEIEDNLHVGHTTIAKIAVWLSERGDGFRTAIGKLPGKQNVSSWTEISEWDSFKRKYSLYFWPELLLKEIIKSASRRQKERIKSVLNRLGEKSKIHKNIEKLLGY